MSSFFDKMRSSLERSVNRDLCFEQSTTKLLIRHFKVPKKRITDLTQNGEDAFCLANWYQLFPGFPIRILTGYIDKPTRVVSQFFLTRVVRGKIKDDFADHPILDCLDKVETTYFPDQKVHSPIGFVFFFPGVRWMLLHDHGVVNRQVGSAVFEKKTVTGNIYLEPLQSYLVNLEWIPT